MPSKKSVKAKPTISSAVSAWAQKKYATVKAYAGGEEETASMVKLLIDDRRAEAAELGERSRTDILRAKMARENGHALAADQLETHARFLDSRADELLEEVKALEAVQATSVA